MHGIATVPHHYFVYITATGRREDGHEAEPPGPPSRSCRSAYNPAAVLCVVATSSFHDVMPCLRFSLGIDFIHVAPVSYDLTCEMTPCV